jgi:hypothetical protein
LRTERGEEAWKPRQRQGPWIKQISGGAEALGFVGDGSIGNFEPKWDEFRGLAFQEAFSGVERKHHQTGA